MPIDLNTLVVGVALAVALMALGLFLRERALRQTHEVPHGFQAEISLPHQAQWTLYHNPFSLCSKKIRVCLKEYGVNYDSVVVDLIETGCYQNISREFLKVNPAATVPVLLHNGHPIYESHEQLGYLASLANHGDLLLPRDAQARQVMDKWVEKTSLLGDDPISSPEATAGNAAPGLTIPIFASMVASTHLIKIAEGVLFHRIKKRAIFFLLMKLNGLEKTLKLKPVVDIINRSAIAMAAHLDDLESELEQSGGPWICGDQFTLADVGMMVILDRLREGDWLDQLLHKRPAICDYWIALQQRPSYHNGCVSFAHPRVIAATIELAALKKASLWPSDISR